MSEISDESARRSARPSAEVIREFPDRGTLWLLEDPRNVGDLLRILDEASAELLDFDHAERVNRSFIPADLQKRESDLIFRVPIRTVEAAEVWVYVLVEHQSAPDPELPLRVLGYMLQLWESQRRAFADEAVPASERRYTPVIPILLYTGEAAWHFPQRLSGMMEGPEVLVQFVPCWETRVLNVKGTPPEELLRLSTAVGWVLRVLQEERSSYAALEQAMHEAIAGLEALPEERGGQWLRAVWYLVLLAFHRREMREYNELSRGLRLWTAESKFRSTEEVQDMVTAAQAYEARGEARGEAKGLRRAVTQVIERRFGSLPDDVRARIEDADAATLGVWLDRALDAVSLEEVRAGLR